MELSDASDKYATVTNYATKSNCRATQTAAKFTKDEPPQEITQIMVVTVYLINYWFRYL